MHRNNPIQLPRVILVSPIPPPYGGIARWTRAVLDMDLSNLQVDIALVNTAHRFQRTDETSLGVRVFTGLTQTARVIYSLVSQIMRNGKPECVHVNSSGSMGLLRDNLVLLICKLMRIRTVLHLRFGRGPDLLVGAGTESYLFRVALKLSDVTICIDSGTFTAVQNWSSSVRTVLIPNFVQTSHRAPQFSRSRKTVLFLGSVLASKGVIELLEAWQSREQSDGWSLQLVGPIAPSMEQLLLDLGKEASVEFIGAADHEAAMSYMDEASILVLPSHSEGFPNVVLEAMAAGTPVIASAVGAIPQMLTGGAGVVVPARDIAALANALEELICSQTRRENMARKAYERVVTEYSAEVVIAQYRGIWKS